MKKRKALAPVVALLGAGLLTFFIITGIASHLMTSPESQKTTSCGLPTITHFVNIRDGKVDPSDVLAKRCDKLTIINHDSQIRLIAFGKHDHHEAYDGVFEKPLDQEQSLTVTLNKAGTYLFHDHLDDSIKGSFTVK